MPDDSTHHTAPAHGEHDHTHHHAPSDSGGTHRHDHAAPGGNGHHDHHAHMIADFRRRFWVVAILTVPVLVLSPMLQRLVGLEGAIRFPGSTWVSWTLASIIYLYGGWPFLKGLVDELRRRVPGMMTLIGVAITTAYLYSSAVVFGLGGKVFFWELATLIDVMLLGHWIEMRSVLGASRALESLARLLPSTASRLTADGTVEEVEIAALRPGDRVLVKPGERIPVDGVVLEGESSVNEALLTGESAPVPKAPGAEVIGGSTNGEGSLVVEVRRTGAESYLSQVIELVQEAQRSRSRAQDIADRAARWLTGIALGGGAATFVVWSLVPGGSVPFALERAVTVMVIACPHALGLAVPLVVAISTALAASNGLLIRDRRAFERARELQAVVFDKTGTLTEGRFGVTDVVVLDDRWDREELLRLAAAVEAHSEHPIATGIVAAVTDPPAVRGFRAIPGKGAVGTVEGHEIAVVSPGYLRERGIAVDTSATESLATEGKTVVYVLVDDRPAGAIALADVIRPESRAAVARLKEMGIEVILLTGDNRRVAAWVAAELGLDDYFAEVLPHEKAAKIQEVRARGRVTAMVGDGVNDAPALATADVGIAIGAGTDVAVEAADVILVRNDPRDVVAIVGLSQATYRKMIENLWWAAGYNIVAIPLAAGVLAPLGVVLSPAVGAALMSVSTVVVAINARRLRYTGPT